MPVPKGWYEDFKKIVISSEHLRKESGGFYLRTPDDKFVFGPKDLLGGEIKLLALNNEQIETLYNAVEKGGVMIAFPNGGKNFKAIYTTKNGNCKSTVGFNQIRDEEYSGPVKANLEKYDKIPDEMIMKETQIQGLNQMVKTVTDMYGGNQTFDDLVDGEWILDNYGMPIERSKNPWDHYEKVFNSLNLEEGVYLQNVPSKEGPEENTYKLAKEQNQFKSKKQNEVMIKPAVKASTLFELDKVAGALNEIKTKNPLLGKLQKECSKTMEDLSKTTDMKEFKKKVGEFSKSADEYFAQMGGANLSKGKAVKLGIVNKVRKIRDAVEQNKEFEIKEDKIAEMQERIAAKFVSAYTNNALKRGTPAEQQEAREILADSRLFADKVNKTMGTAAFQYLYGLRPGNKPIELTERLMASMNAKPSSILSSMGKEIKNPSPARLQHQAFMKEKAPLRYNPNKKHETMSLQEQAVVLDKVSKMNELLKELGPRNSSPEYAAVMHDLSVTELRLKNKNTYMDVKAQMAQLGDSIDAYLSKKMKETSLNKKEIKKVSALTELQNTCDAVAANKTVAPPKSQDEHAKDILSTRLATNVVQGMLNSKDPKIQRMGKKLELDKTAFANEKAKIKNSAAFKQLFGGEGMAQVALGQKITKVSADLAKRQAELDGKEISLTTKVVEKTKEIQQKIIEKENKILEKDKIGTEPIVGGI